jgi:hypothetical protein
VRKNKCERMKDEVKTRLFSELSFSPYPSAFVNNTGSRIIARPIPSFLMATLK